MTQIQEIRTNYFSFLKYKVLNLKNYNMQNPN